MSARPSDHDVERVARALSLHDDCSCTDWHELPDYGKDRYRDKARVAIAAMQQPVASMSDFDCRAHRCRRQAAEKDARIAGLIRDHAAQLAAKDREIAGLAVDVAEYQTNLSAEANARIAAEQRADAAMGLLAECDESLRSGLQYGTYTVWTSEAVSLRDRIKALAGGAVARQTNRQLQGGVAVTPYSNETERQLALYRKAINQIDDRIEYRLFGKTDITAILQELTKALHGPIPELEDF